MDDLIAFLRARLDEDVARGARLIGLKRNLSERWSELVIESEALRELAVSGARLLAEVDAKRRLMSGHGPGRLIDDSDGKWETDPENWDAPYRLCTGHEWVGYPCETLRLLALPYADHPDYRAEWHPDHRQES